MQDNAISIKDQLVPWSETLPMHKHEETWKILADCQVSLPLARLLKLVPRFTEKVATRMAQKDA